MEAVGESKMVTLGRGLPLPAWAPCWGTRDRPPSGRPPHRPRLPAKPESRSGLTRRQVSPGDIDDSGYSAYRAGMDRRRFLLTSPAWAFATPLVAEAHSPAVLLLRADQVIDQ